MSSNMGLRLCVPIEWVKFLLLGEVHDKSPVRGGFHTLVALGGVTKSCEM